MPSTPELAASLATIAIASLGGPLPAVGAGLGEVVKHARVRYERGEKARELRNAVERGIRAWAAGEGYAVKNIELGLALATETVAKHGAEMDELTELDFDAGQISKRVCQRASKSDRGWGKEDHYAVAEAAIRCTYRVLARQLQDQEPVLLPVVRAIRAALDEHAAALKDAANQSLGSLQELLAALVEGATTAEIMDYLEARIADWDRSVWDSGPHTPSSVERRLHVRTSNRDGQEVDFLTAADALTEHGMLVVLGGPGSGKTWLARRYARESAERARSLLLGGASLDDVELPLLTTWDQWTKADGDVRTSLVIASFAARLGYSDLGSGDQVARLQRAFTRNGSKVLVVVDSLDEAADVRSQIDPLRSLTTLRGWSVVVTSRPAAWDANSRNSGNTPQLLVAEIEDLEYPDDVNGFVNAWFTQDSMRAKSLLDQLKSRPELREASVVPLILTFYCLLTEESSVESPQLPRSRRDLYVRLVKRLLRGGWSATAQGPDTAPDLDYCVDVLTQWAWSAVEESVTEAGLGAWGETFLQPFRPRRGEERAIDHVAPRVSEDGEGNVTRRFVHRTILEHLVAEYIACRSTGEAAAILLPHLWFDPDWSIAAPAAIAHHNRTHPGELMARILEFRCSETPSDEACRLVDQELDDLLLKVMAESDQQDWSGEIAASLNGVRLGRATSSPHLITRTAHWTTSNPRVRTAVINALPGTGPRQIPAMVSTLTALAPNEKERKEAQDAILHALPDTGSWNIAELVSALSALATDEKERKPAREAIIRSLPRTGSRQIPAMVSALTALAPNERESELARRAVIGILPDAQPRRIPQLVSALTALEPNEKESELAWDAILHALPDAEPWQVPQLVATLTALALGEQDSGPTRNAVLHALPAAGPGQLSELALALIALAPNEKEGADAREAILQALPGAEPLEISELVSALTALAPNEKERKEGQDAILHSLPDAPPAETRALIGALTALAPGEQDSGPTRNAVLHALPAAEAGAPETLAHLRALSTAGEWLDWLSLGRGLYIRHR